jgi:hypothetical protein
MRLPKHGTERIALLAQERLEGDLEPAEPARAGGLRHS